MCLHAASSQPVADSGADDSEGVWDGQAVVTEAYPSMN